MNAVSDRSAKIQETALGVPLLDLRSNIYHCSIMEVKFMRKIRGERTVLTDNVFPDVANTDNAPKRAPDSEVRPKDFKYSAPIEYRTTSALYVKTAME